MDNKITIGYLGLIENNGVYFNEAEIGNLHTKKNNKGKLLKIDVYTNEGENIPHFHFYELNKNDKNKIDGCLELFRAQYFKHGNHKSELTDSQLSILNDWLKKKCTHSKQNETNWEYAVNIWIDNKKNSIYNNVKQPDYSDANEKVYYRITIRNGEGIYQALKKASGSYWSKLLDNKDINWLPKPKIYKDNYISYFTNEGYKKFIEKTYKHVIQYIDPENIEVRQYTNIGKNIEYKDDHQIIMR